MILEDFVLLASDTARTKAYLQMMAREGKLPSKCIVYTDDFLEMKNKADQYISSADGEYFNLNEPVLYTIQQNGIRYEVVDNKDINSDVIAECIEKSKEKFFIYSGYGGYILKPHLFQLGKKFLHVHAGILPQYRGSTTAYYSMLQEGDIGATAIFLSEGIDEGEILCQERFSVPRSGVNIDTLYEPYLRSQVLKKALMLYEKDGELKAIPQSDETAEIYYIIHPVLKHLALMSLK